MNNFYKVDIDLYHMLYAMKDKMLFIINKMLIFEYKLEEKDWFLPGQLRKTF